MSVGVLLADERSVRQQQKIRVNTDDALKRPRGNRLKPCSVSLGVQQLLPVSVVETLDLRRRCGTSV